jgi:hypothetical protein
MVVCSLPGQHCKLGTIVSTHILSNYCIFWSILVHSEFLALCLNFKQKSQMLSYTFTPTYADLACTAGYFTLLYIYLELWRKGKMKNRIRPVVRRSMHFHQKLNVKWNARRSNDVSTRDRRPSGYTATCNSTDLTPCHVMLSTCGCPDIYYIFMLWPWDGSA